MSAAPGTLFTSRCPHCHQSGIFAGVYAIKDRCDVCGAVFLRDEGNWIGATVLSYMLGSVFVVLLLLGMWSTGALFEKGSEWTVSGLTLVFMLLTLRLVKAFWVGLLYDWGYVYPDPPTSEAASAPWT